MSSSGLNLKSADVTVEKLLAGTGAEYKSIGIFGRFAIKWHEFFGDFAAARGIAEKNITRSTNDTSLDDRSAQALDLETLLFGKINERLDDGNRLEEGRIVRNPPGCKPGLYEVKDGKLVEHGLKNGVCVHNPVGCEKGTYQVEVNGSHGSLKKLWPNTVVLNPRGALGGVYVVGEDGDLAMLDRGSAGTYVINPRGVDANGERLKAGFCEVVSVDGSFSLQQKGTCIIAEKDARVIGPGGEEKSLSAGEAYRMGKDGQTFEKLAPGTVFPTDVGGGEKRPYVVKDNGQARELFCGEFVQISGDGSTDSEGKSLDPGFYRVNRDGKLVPQQKGECVVVNMGITVFKADGKRLALGAYRVGADGQTPEKIDKPGTAFTAVVGGEKRPYVVKDNGLPTWLRIGEFVQISGDGSTGFKGERLKAGLYRVSADGNFSLQQKGTCIIAEEGATVIDPNGEEKSLDLGFYKVDADGQSLKEVKTPGTVFTAVDACNYKRSYVVDNNGEPTELRTGEFVQISGSNEGIDAKGERLKAGFYGVGEDGNFVQKKKGDCVVVDWVVTKGFDANGNLLPKGVYRVGDDGQPKKIETHGTVFTADDGEGKHPYVVGADGQPTKLEIGEFVQISGDGSTGSKGERLKPGFYEVKDGEFVLRKKGERVVVDLFTRIFGPGGEFLFEGAYIVGAGGQDPEKIEKPGTVFTADDGAGKHPYVVKDNGQPTKLEIGNFVQISGGKGTDANGNRLAEGFYRVGADGKLVRKKKGECVVVDLATRGFDDKGKSLPEGAYRVGDGGQISEKLAAGTVFTDVDGAGKKRLHVVGLWGQPRELNPGEFVQISGGKGTDSDGEPLEAGFYEVDKDGKFKQKNAGDRVVITKDVRGFDANGKLLSAGKTYIVGDDGWSLTEAQN